VVVLANNVPAEAWKWRHVHEATGTLANAAFIIPRQETVLRERARVTGSCADAALQDCVVV